MIEHRNKNDLCSDTVTLDYQHLLRTSLIAVRYAKIRVEETKRYFYRLDNELVPSVYTEEFAEAANDLRIAMDMYRVIREGLSREHVKIVNKPAPSDTV